MRLMSLLVLTFAALLGICFALLNSEFVVVNYFVGTQRLPLSLLILGVLILGMGLGWLLSFLP